MGANTPLPPMAAPSLYVGSAHAGIEYVKPYVGPVSQVYASDDIGHDEMWSDTPNQAWAPHLRPDVDGIPDAQRLRTVNTVSYRPGPQYPAHTWSDGPGAVGKESLYRHQAVESPDTPPNQILGRTEIKNRAANPYWFPPPEPRPTTQMMPASRTYMRPFDQDPQKGFNGQHFSLADHRRNYEVFGMEPMRDWRNTSYSQPGPWDVNIVDAPANYDLPHQRLAQTDIPVRSMYAPLG